MVLDSVRTLVIWLLSLPLFHEKFIPMQLLGFAFLILGMFVYNDLLFGPYVREKLLPRLSGSPALFCSRFWGVDLEVDQQEESLIGDADQDEEPTERA